MRRGESDTDTSGRQELAGGCHRDNRFDSKLSQIGLKRVLKISRIYSIWGQSDLL